MDLPPACFDISPGLVERQGQTIHLPGQFARMLPVVRRGSRQSRIGWNEPAAPQEKCRPLVFVHLLQVELAGTRSHELRGCGEHHLPASGQWEEAREQIQIFDIVEDEQPVHVLAQPLLDGLHRSRVIGRRRLGKIQE